MSNSKKSKKTKKVSAAKRTRREPHAGSEDLVPSKSDIIRGYFRDMPEITYEQVTERLAKLNLRISDSQFYRLRREIRPTLESNSTAAVCTMQPEPEECKVSVDQVLKAQQILERAYLAAWSELGQDFAAVDKIVKSVHTKHRNHKAIQ